MIRFRRAIRYFREIRLSPTPAGMYLSAARFAAAESVNIRGTCARCGLCGLLKTLTPRPQAPSAAYSYLTSYLRFRRRVRGVEVGRRGDFRREDRTSHHTESRCVYCGRRNSPPGRLARALFLCTQLVDSILARLASNHLLYCALKCAVGNMI